MLGNARGGVKLNIFGGARSAPRFFIPFWVEKLGLGGGGITPPREPRGGVLPLLPPYFLRSCQHPKESYKIGTKKCFRQILHK